MNLNTREPNQHVSSRVTAQELHEQEQSIPGASPCEFELLLQRAVEVLSARARLAQAPHSN